MLKQSKGVCFVYKKNENMMLYFWKQNKTNKQTYKQTNKQKNKQQKTKNKTNKQQQQKQKRKNKQTNKQKKRLFQFGRKMDFLYEDKWDKAKTRWQSW